MEILYGLYSRGKLIRERYGDSVSKVEDRKVTQTQCRIYKV